MKTLTKEDLQIGDVLIFEDFDFNYTKFRDHVWEDGIKGGADYLLHYMIAWFDPGKEGADYRNIYHAAIWANVDRARDKSIYEDCVVEAGKKGIISASLKETLTHPQVMNVYVCRKKDKPAGFEQKINESVRLLYAKQGYYSFETAWLLAVICSMRYTEGTLFKILEKQLGTWQARLFSLAILELINQYNDGHQRDMVACSTLVAMMYKNAGFELPVHVFQAIAKQGLVKPKIDLSPINQKEFESQLAVDISKPWPELKETIVTPRQLMESSDLTLVGVLPHQKD